MHCLRLRPLPWTGDDGLRACFRVRAMATARRMRMRDSEALWQLFGASDKMLDGDGDVAIEVLS